jgi:transposase
LGALEAHTLHLITVTNDCYINALSVCQLLLKLRLLFPDDPLTVVLDNARYQRCRLVLDVATALEIELLFLPPYSPNLNLIERLWKFVKKECLTTQYYVAFDPFKKAITSCLAHTQDIHKDKLATLLTLKFQTFDNVIL